MATAELKVRIDADIAAYQAALIKAAKATDQAENSINKSVQGVAKSFTLLNNTKFTFGQNYISASQALANQAKKTSDTLGGATVQGSNRAALALNNLSRVAQDAPFGFIGIQNNLNPLLESFQALKKESGSTGGALKALGGSLMGAGGLGLALSLVSAAVLFAQMGLRAWGVTAEKSGKDAKSAADGVENYAESLNQVTRAQLLGAQSAAQETTTLSLLFKQYQNSNIPLQKRKSAYEELQRLYPAYFGNIAFEEKASVATKNAYDRLTTSILATARARAAGDLITKNSQRQLENEQKIIDLGIELTKAQTKADKARAINLASIGTAGQEGTGSIVNTIAESKALKVVESIRSQINNIKTDSNLLTEKNLQLEKSINTEIDKGADLTSDKLKSSNKQIKSQSDILAELAIDLQKVANAVDITFGKGNEQKIAAFAKAIDGITEIGGDRSIIQRLQQDILNLDQSALKLTGKTVGVTLSAGIKQGLASTAPVIAKDLSTKLKGGLTEWQSYVNNDLLPSIQNNFQTFFNDILMRGKFSFDSLGKAILNTFISILASESAKGVVDLLKFNTGREYSDSLQKGKGGGLIGKGISLLGLFGGKAAAGGAAATGGTAALATGTAATGGALLPILAGIAAVAGIASLLKKRKVEPQPAFTTSNAISTSSSSNVDFGNGRVVFEISGVNLVGVLNRAGAKLQRFGP